MLSMEEAKRVQAFVYKLAEKNHLTDKALIDEFILRAVSKESVEEAAVAIAEALNRKIEDKSIDPKSIAECSEEFFAICPDKCGSKEAIEECSKELNHKYVHDCMVDFGKLVEGTDLEFFLTGGLPVFLATDTPLSRKHGDIDILFNEEGLEKLKKLVEQSEDFTLGTTLDTKGEGGHEYYLQYKDKPMSVGLFLYSKNKETGEVSLNSYYYNYTDKETGEPILDREEASKRSEDEVEKELAVNHEVLSKDYAEMVFGSNKLNYEGMEIPVVSMEYLFDKKMNSGREKDRNDAKMLLDAGLINEDKYIRMQTAKEQGNISFHRE